jgi:hypothetical protein
MVLRLPTKPTIYELEFGELPSSFLAIETLLQSRGGNNMQPLEHASNAELLAKIQVNPQRMHWCSGMTG